MFFVTQALADQWPAWRGIHQNGLTSETEIPLHWSETENIHWKIELSGVGHSSPIVWGDAVFITSANKEKLTRHLLCVDRETGRELWDRVITTAPIEPMHRDNTPATTTPVTDGQHVFVSFCDAGRLLVAAVSFDGQIVWKSRPGSFTASHGFGTALVLDGNSLFLSGLQDGQDAFVAALDKTNGHTIWKVKRPRAIRSYSTPHLCDIKGRPALLLSGAEQTIAYDRTTGETLWEIDGPAEKTASSIVYSSADQLAFVCGGRDDQLFAIQLDAEDQAEKDQAEKDQAEKDQAEKDQADKDKAEKDQADKDQAHAEPRIAWRATKGVPYMNSPLCDKCLLHIVSDDGVYRCFRTHDGKVLKVHRVGASIRASMVGNSDRIYITSVDGKTTVIANNADFDVLAENQLDGTFIASPAISNGDLIFRTETHLILIRQPAALSELSQKGLSSIHFLFGKTDRMVPTKIRRCSLLGVGWVSILQP
jgi:outer membrane protein assembly factor BamB